MVVINGCYSYGAPTKGRNKWVTGVISYNPARG